MSRTPRFASRFAVVLLPVALAACPAVKPTPTPAARLTLSPAALLVPGVGESARLVVKAFDAEGNEVPAPPLQFAASGSAISVSGDGVVTGAADGTGRVTVTAGALSAAASVLVARTVPGATLVSDEQWCSPFAPSIRRRRSRSATSTR